MEAQRYLVKVSTPNRMVEINGKLIRTPLEHIARENELPALKTKLVYDSITFTVEDYVKPVAKKKSETITEAPKVESK